MAYLAAVSIVFLVLAVKPVIGFIGAVKDHDTASVIAYGLLAVLALFFAVRSARLAVITTPIGLVARNLFMSRRVRWEQIDHFELGQKDPLPLVGIAVLKDGHGIGLSALQPFGPGVRDRTKFATDAVAALNAEISERRSDG